MKKLFFVLFLTLGLVSCKTAPIEPPVEKIVYKFIAVPKELTKKVTLTAPPNPATYSVLPWDQKEEMLMGLIQNHAANITTCNIRLDAIDVWSLNQSKIYTTP